MYPKHNTKKSLLHIYRSPVCILTLKKHLSVAYIWETYWDEQNTTTDPFTFKDIDSQPNMIKSARKA